MAERVHNFNPGPGVLPEEVVCEVQENLLSYKNSGIGLMEMSHRSKDFEAIIGETEADLRSLLGLSADYAVLFTTGGASLQFSMVPMNLLRAGIEGNYLLSDVWGELAAEEAKKFGAVHIAGSTKEGQYHSLPIVETLSANPAYLHFTSNNTVVGTQFPKEPDAPREIPLICDASSDLLSRPIDCSRYGLIYAGAQKNLGPAGVTLVIVRRDLLTSAPESIPLLMNYRTYEKHRSLYNTPPAVNIYVVGRVLAWVKRNGGVQGMAKQCGTKAELVYSALDRSPLFMPVAATGARSKMNITFRLRTPELESKFLAQAEQRKLIGLKGHRNVGGCRASLYNACPLVSAQALAGFIDEFAKENG